MSYEIQRSEIIAFAYTIKDNRKVSNEERNKSYEQWFKRLEVWRIPIEYKCEEKDKQGKLHIHGIIYLKKGFYRKKLMMPNLHLKLVELHNREGWIKYIHKDLLDTTEIHDIYPDPEEDTSILSTNISLL